MVLKNCGLNFVPTSAEFAEKKGLQKLEIIGIIVVTLLINFLIS